MQSDNCDLSRHSSQTSRQRLALLRHADGLAPPAGRLRVLSLHPQAPVVPQTPMVPALNSIC